VASCLPFQCPFSVKDVELNISMRASSQTERQDKIVLNLYFHDCYSPVTYRPTCSSPVTYRPTCSSSVTYRPTCSSPVTYRPTCSSPVTYRPTCRSHLTILGSSDPVIYADGSTGRSQTFHLHPQIYAPSLARLSRLNS
jgi:hypothetical protein